ncbi:hypothetical protein BTU51_1044 [Rickettsia rickettsii]|uniref:Uncharacterized protein n=1 Tax=Rickettsia rickettsii (strain Iowa) TaxID=452659 RepID=B0BYC0_RICRO|nr:hypothetical protein RrIowa_1044 [Rickettsia rickettsii str. Iowa]APU55796.1 hypothetical protein BTU50_1044 [Rickettsia rickettsii]APU57173.1 hypothetical protein BTU51_1044 [Rickettsia rickettsii]
MNTYNTLRFLLYVIPAQAGIQQNSKKSKGYSYFLQFLYIFRKSKNSSRFLYFLDSRLRGNDIKQAINS